MAKAIRPIFISSPESPRLVDEVNLPFEWFLGMARTQRQKSLQSFHAEAKDRGYSNVLEISTYSNNPIGVKLSTFNLTFKSTSSFGTVEKLYQNAKVIKAKMGDAPDEVNKKNKGVKPDHFLFEGYKWPLNPQTCFYDWLYINALNQNEKLAKDILEYNAFTDIAFNPKKSLNTQARSAALYVSLAKLGKIEQTKKPEDFINLLRGYGYMNEPQNLFNLKN